MRTPINTPSPATRPLRSNDVELTRLLSQRFGDGLIYLSGQSDRTLLQGAIDRGLVSTDGQITAAGYRLCRRLSLD